jgi:solute carrier family 35 protein E1
MAIKGDKRTAPGRTYVYLLVLAYYVASTLSSCVTKQLIQHYPRPLTVALAQQIIATLGSVARMGSFHSAIREWRTVLPVAIATTANVVLYRIALVYISLSFAQAIKTLQPLFAVMLSSVLLHERNTPRRVLALVLLLCGVAIATSTEVSFSLVGFACCVAAVFAQALQAVLQKSLLVHNGMPAEEVFASAAVCELGILMPLWVAVDAPAFAAGQPPHLIESGALPLLLLNSACNFATQLLSFAVLCAVVSPVTTAVVSTFKRVVTIVCAVVWFHTPITLMHALGIVLAVVGVLLYEEAHASMQPSDPKAAMPLLHEMPLSLVLNPRRGKLPGAAASANGVCNGAHLATERRPCCRGLSASSSCSSSLCAAV